MKSNHNFFIAALLAIALMSSCEKTINVNTPPFARTLTVNSYSTTGEPLYLVTGKSAAIKDQRYSPDLLVPDATVKLYVDDVYTETLPFDSYGYMGNTIAQAGKRYTVKISAPTYDDVEASSVAPSPVHITSLVYAAHARKDENGDQQDAITITFDDPAAANDYYIIKLRPGNDSNFRDYRFCVNSPDASVESSSSDDVGDVNTCLDNRSIFLRDALFNGRQKEIKFYVNSQYVQPGYNGMDSTFSAIELLHVPEEYFRFEKSYRVASDANGNPFAEPVNVYTNISKGQGIFAIISKDEREIR